MEIRHLRLIKAIVEEGSIANTISKLHLTASALSHQLKEAEQQLGTPVFLRVNKKLVLTPAGKKVYASANIILQELEKVSREIQELAAGETGVIRICTQYYTTYHWLPALVRRFREAFSGIDVQIVFEDASAQLEKLLHGDIDLLMTCLERPHKHIHYTSLFRDEMVALAPDGHPWTGKPFVTAEDFRDVNLIVHSLPLDTVAVHTAVLAPAGVTPRNITVMPVAETALEMTRAGLGISVMARSAISPLLAEGRIRAVRITEEGLYKHQYIARLHQEHTPAYQEHFIRFLQEAVLQPGGL